MTSREHRPVTHPSRDHQDTIQQNLLDALRAAWQLCEDLDPGPLPNGRRAGTNLPELLSQALTDLATELGSTERLVEHRPGCWEADHVRALGQLL